MITEYIKMNLGFRITISTAGVMILLGHFSACIFYFTARISDF